MLDHSHNAPDMTQALPLLQRSDHPFHGRNISSQSLSRRPRRFLRFIISGEKIWLLLGLILFISGSINALFWQIRPHPSPLLKETRPDFFKAKYIRPAEVEKLLQTSDKDLSFSQGGDPIGKMIDTDADTGMPLLPPHLSPSVPPPFSRRPSDIKDLGRAPELEAASSGARNTGEDSIGKLLTPDSTKRPPADSFYKR